MLKNQHGIPYGEQPQECAAAGVVETPTLKEQDKDKVAMEYTGIGNVKETNVKEQ